MPYNLKGRKILVTGGSKGLGAEICEKFAKEGCHIVINYNSDKSAADNLVKQLQSRYPDLQVSAFAADMGVEADVLAAVQHAARQLGGLDIIISNAGYTRFSKFEDLTSTTTADWDKCYAINVKANLYLMREAASQFNANPDGGVFIITSSIAGVNPSGSSMPYSVTKAAQLHLMKCLAASQGPKIRVNAVLPGLLLTEWGNLYGPERVKALTEAARLKKVTDLEDCAQAFVDIARNASMTGQKIQVDSGLGVN